MSPLIHEDHRRGPTLIHPDVPLDGMISFSGQQIFDAGVLLIKQTTPNLILKLPSLDGVKGELGTYTLLVRNIGTALFMIEPALIEPTRGQVFTWHGLWLPLKGTYQ